MKTKLYTIGHSNHTTQSFVRLLEDNGIMTVVDVRTVPRSRFSPHFDAESVERLLPRHGIQYAFAGRWLGGRPKDPTCYRGGSLPEDGVDYLHEVDYQEIMTRSWFLEAIERLLEMARSQTTAVMCSEEDPAKCHRHHLIARYLLDEHPEIDVRHIRGDGTVYSAAAVRVTLEVDDFEQLSLW
jgi:uncharacterized protein (DUF488 family)